MTTGASSDSAGSLEHARYLQTRSFGSLDGLRALSIMAVVWHHTVGSLGQQWIVASRGFLGVDLFFAISGFLIVTLLLRERRRTGTISLRGFYARRVLRIFPAYYATLGFVAFMAYARPGSTAAELRHDLPYAFCYVSNLVPMQSLLAITWSLSVEEQFYCVVPTLQKYMHELLPLMLPGAYILATLPSFGLFPGIALPNFFRETTFGPILLGVMLAHALDKPRWFAAIHALLRHKFSPLIALVLVVATCSLPMSDISGWPRITIHFALLLLVASCVVREDHALVVPLTFWPIRRIGIVSYGIYLYHKLILHVALKAADQLEYHSELVQMGVVLLGAWLVAELSYRGFESRFLRLKARFAS